MSILKLKNILTFTTGYEYHLLKFSGLCVTKLHSCMLVVRCDTKRADNKGVVMLLNLLTEQHRLLYSVLLINITATKKLGT